MTVPARWSRGSKALLIAVGAIALVAILMVAWAQFAIARRWKAMEQRITELTGEARTRDGRRPPVLLPPRPGNSWSGYASALQFAAPTLERDFIKLRPERGGPALEKFLDAHAPAFEHLLIAGHGGENRGPYDWSRLDPAGFPKESPYRYDNILVAVAMLQFRRLADSGRMEQALPLLLAVGQMGHDFGDNGVGFTLISAEGALHQLNEECRRLLSEDKLGPDLLRELDRGLQVLDRGYAGHSLKNGILAYGQMFQRGETLEWGGPGPEKEIRAGWRALYSPSVLKADAFFRALRWADELAEASRGPLAEEEKVRSRMQADAEASDNRLAITLMRDLDQWSAQRAWLADLRIVRTAAHYLATEEVLSLEDPFGKVLFAERSGRELTIWSAGKDYKGLLYPKIQPLIVRRR